LTLCATPRVTDAIKILATQRDGATRFPKARPGP
jgi:hypothetical protein